MPIHGSRFKVQGSSGSIGSVLTNSACQLQLRLRKLQLPVHGSRFKKFRGPELAIFGGYGVLHSVLLILVSRKLMIAGTKLATAIGTEPACRVGPLAGNVVLVDDPVLAKQRRLEEI